MAIEVPDVNLWLPDIDVPEFEIAGWRQQYNAIVDFWADPCEAPFYVYIQLLLPILGSAVLFLLTPSTDEIIETFVEPKGYGSCFRDRRQKRGNKHKTVTPRTGKKFKLAFPDPDEFIASRLPGRQFFADRRIGTNEAWLWKVFNQYEKRAIQLLLLDMVGSTVYAWHSALLNTEWCMDSALQVAKCMDTEWHQGAIPYFQVVPQIGPKSARNGGDAGLNGIQLTRNAWRGLASGKLSNFGATPAVGTFRIQSGNDNVLRVFSFNIPPQGSQDFGYTMQMRGVGSLEMAVQVDSGSVFIHDTVLWGTQVAG